MGLLDALNSDDARLGLGLLAAGGYSPTPMSVGQRVQMAMQGMDAQKQNQLKTKLMQSQIDENTSQNAARAAALDKQLQLSKMVQTLFGQGQGAAPTTSPGAFEPSVDGMGPTMPQSMQAPQGQGGSRLAGLNIDQVAGLKALGGPDLFEAYKWTKDLLQLQQGSTYIDRTTGQSKFMPKVGEGIAPDANGFYAPLPGYAASQGAIEGAKTGAIEGAKAGYDLVKVVGPDGAERYVPRSTVLGTAPPGQPQPAARPAKPMAPIAGDSDRFAILSQELEKAKASGNVADVASLEREIGRLPASARTANTTSGLATPGFQATPTTAQKLSSDAGGKVNETWLKTSYEPVKVAGDAANDMLTNVEVARQSMRAMPGGTGWGAEAKATGAAILTSLGIAPANAQLYATNAQTFQSASMSNLQTVLNAAKGPQTEGDADRAGKTFAQLKNTPKANEFILDLAEAKAQRDQMKAQFYEQALPIARAKGDLQEVDREWRKRAPSVFTMPSMKRWGEK